eukprot:4327175-Prymnesium_polylepis.1
MEGEECGAHTVKLTAASDGMSHGRSCIMHSRRVGDLKAVRLASAYLGLTNSGTAPPDASSVA